MNQKRLLKQTFESAKEHSSPFVFIEVNAEGVEEVIVIPKRSFDAKETFYEKAYNDELVHVMNSNVRIQGFSHGKLGEIQNHI